MCRLPTDSRCRGFTAQQLGRYQNLTRMGDGVDVTVVLDAEGLRGAVEHRAKHIELRAHVDLTTLDPLLEGQGLSSSKLLGYLREEVQTIRVRSLRCITSLRHATPLKRPACATKITLQYRHLVAAIVSVMWKA